MKYLSVIPATLVICFLIYLFTVTLPKQVRTTDIGKRIWPSIERLAGLLFSAIGFCVIILSLVHIFATRWERQEIFEWTLNVIFLMPVTFIGISCILLLLLVITLKTLQFFSIIR